MNGLALAPIDGGPPFTVDVSEAQLDGLAVMLVAVMRARKTFRAHERAAAR